MNQEQKLFVEKLIIIMFDLFSNNWFNYRREMICFQMYISSLNDGIFRFVNDDFKDYDKEKLLFLYDKDEVLVYLKDVTQLYLLVRFHSYDLGNIAKTIKKQMPKTYDEIWLNWTNDKYILNTGS